MAGDNRAESEACLGHQMALSVHVATSDIPAGMDEETACMLTVRMETSHLGSDGRKRYVGCFDYPLFVESSIAHKTLLCKLCDTYPWGCRDSVELKYYDKEQNIWVDVACDDDAALMFGKHQDLC